MIHRILKEILEVGGMLGVAMVIAIFCKTVVLANTIVDGDSMNATLINEEKAIVDRLSYQFGSPKQGDIVAFRLTEDQGFWKTDVGITIKDFYDKLVRKAERERYVKRIIGVPGDVIDIREDKVYVNGEELREPYISLPTKRLSTRIKYPLTVKEGTYFVLGDNRTNSTDSRIIGCIRENMIDGKLLFAYYPFNRLGVIKNPFEQIH